MKFPFFLPGIILLLLSCTKSTENFVELKQNETTGFKKFTIKKGQHHSDGVVYKNVQASELNFIVRFDSSCIYTALSPENQLDVNKLYGISDNNSHHHQYSARIGWRWSDHGLRLFAYVYNDGKRMIEEITKVSIGEEIHCSIKATPKGYEFKVDDAIIHLARASVGAKMSGYLLYPYFGGNEVAPHDVNIWIKNN